MGEDYWHGRSYQLRGTRTPAGTLAILSEGIWFLRNPAGDLAALRRSDGRLGHIGQDGHLHWTGSRLVTIALSMN